MIIFKKQNPKHTWKDYISASELERVDMLKHLDDEEILNLLTMYDQPRVQEPCKAELTIRNIKALNKFSKASSFLAKVMIFLMVVSVSLTLVSVIYSYKDIIYTSLQRLGVIQ